MRNAVFIIGKVNKDNIDITSKLGFGWIFTGGVNLTSNLIADIHRRGMKVIAEVGLFSGKDLWQKYPDCRPIDRNNQPMKIIQGYAGVCPNHPGVRKEKLELINKLVNNLELEGVWLDFIRYPCHWEDIRQTPIEEYCYCDNCRKSYGKTDFGSRDWYGWKTNQIVDFVSEVKKIIGKTGRSIELGLFAVPWRRGEFGDAIIEIIGQDLAKLSAVVDTFTPMTYHLMCDRNTDWVNEVVSETARQTNKPIWPII